MARHCVCQEPSDAASMSSAAAPILRRMSAAFSAEAMILLVLSMWSATGPVGTRPRSEPTGPVRCWGAAARMAASSSVGVAPAIWAAAVEPADVPMVRSAVVTSSPASNRPAMTPISHALPVDPPPPRTKARSPEERCRCSWESPFVTWRALPVATSSVARSWTAGEHPVWMLRSWVSPPADGSRSPRR